MLLLLKEFDLAFGEVPNEPDRNQVIYVENDLNPTLKRYLETNLELVKGIFSNYGLTFTYLTDYINTVSGTELQKAAKYYLPWLKATDLDALREACTINLKELQERLAPKDASGAVINSKGQCFKIDVSDPKLFEEQFRQIAEAYGHKVETGHTMFREARRNLDTPTVREDRPDYNSIPDRWPRRITPTLEESNTLIRLLKQLMSIMPEHDIRQMLLERLRQEEVISKIEINQRRTIYLPDYDIEIRLRPLEMAFYILFLKHPEGIEFIRLVDYRDELLRYYKHYAVNGNPGTINQAIDNLVNPMNDNNVNIQRSRIHHAINIAFNNQFCEAYARQYMITGEKGEPKKILLPRDKVVWKIDL